MDEDTRNKTSSDDKPLPQFFENIIRKHIEDPEPSILEAARKAYHQSRAQSRVISYSGLGDETRNGLFNDFPEDAYTGPLLIFRHPLRESSRTEFDRESSNEFLEVFYLNQETRCIQGMGLYRSDIEDNAAFKDDPRVGQGSSIPPEATLEAAIRMDAGLKSDPPPRLGTTNTDLEDLPLSAYSSKGTRLLQKKSSIDSARIMDSVMEELENTEAAGPGPEKAREQIQGKREIIERKFRSAMTRATRQNFSSQISRFRNALDPDITRLQHQCMIHDANSYNWLAGDGNSRLGQRRQEAAREFPLLVKDFQESTRLCHAIDHGEPLIDAVAEANQCKKSSVRSLR